MEVILVDDELLALDLLERKIKEFGNVTILGKYTNPMEGKEMIVQQNVDVVFLDINLPGINGLELAEQILESKPEVTIVFVTAYDKYAVQAFELNAMDYLVKPVKSDRLKRTIERMKIDHTKVSGYSFRDDYIYINLFLNLSVENRNGNVMKIAWRTAKAREIFLYLLQNQGQLVRKSFLIELLWPELDQDRAFSRLYTTIYQVRKTLSGFPDHFKINNTTDGYVLSVTNVVLDIEEWERRLLAAPPLSSQTITVYEDIMSVYKGAYLREYDYWWAASDQYRWGQLWLEHAHNIATYFRSQKNMPAAKKWYMKICKEYPESEASHFELMKIYALEDERVAVHKQYQILTNILQEELGLKPGSEITSWFVQWEEKKNQLTK